MPRRTDSASRSSLVRDTPRFRELTQSSSETEEDPWRSCSRSKLRRSEHPRCVWKKIIRPRRETATVMYSSSIERVVKWQHVLLLVAVYLPYARSSPCPCCRFLYLNLDPLRFVSESLFPSLEFLIAKRFNSNFLTHLRSILNSSCFFFPSSFRTILYFLNVYFE